MLGSPQHHNNAGASMIDPFSTMLGGVHANAYGGGGRTYQSGFVAHDEPAVINNKTSFMQSLNNQH